MKMMLVALLLLFLSGCGYTQRDAELIGQVKKVSHITPLICPDYTAVDVSLGVLRGGVGSMSTQDVWLRVLNNSDIPVLKRAAEDGALVRIKYDVRRATLCYQDHNLLYVEMVK